MVLQEQPHAQGCDRVTVRVTTDPETDRLLSMRASSRIPLPPEISLADPRSSPRYFRMAAFYDAYGLGFHPVVALLKKELVDTMMSSALARSDHLDRISHYGAWLGNEDVRIENLVPAPTEEGRASGPRRGRPLGRRRSRRCSSVGQPLSRRGRPSDAEAADAHPQLAYASGGCGRQTGRAGATRGASPGDRRPSSQRRRRSPLPPLLREGMDFTINHKRVRGNPFTESLINGIT